ncbi:MAG: hypothetical protein IJ313_13025 [Clostridia bacterium]|nr:hypothetical protein [Clostridia bacterium]
MLIALLIHELWHYVAGRIVGEQIDQLELTPFGGIMRYKRGTVSHKGLRGVFVHAAGPLGNYMCLLAAGMPVIQKAVSPELLRSLIVSNASMLVLNVLPALPLDGGQIVFCLGYYFFPIAKLANCLSVLGIAVGISGVLLAVYGLIIRQMLNCSLVIVSLYLIVCARKSQRSLIAENIYAVVQERLTESIRIKRIEHYQVAPDTALFELIAFLKQDAGVMFSFSEGSRVHVLTEYVFCHALLTVPSMTIREACLNSAQYKEKMTNEPENTRFPS